MDLSYNNLTGRIPSGSQLDTLSMQQIPPCIPATSAFAGLLLKIIAQALMHQSKVTQQKLKMVQG